MLNFGGVQFFIVGPLCVFRFRCFFGPFLGAGSLQRKTSSGRNAYAFAMPLKRMGFETTKTRKPATKRLLFLLTKKK